MKSGSRPGDVGFARDPKSHYGKLHSHIPTFYPEASGAKTFNLQASSQSSKRGVSLRIHIQQSTHLRLIRSTIAALLQRSRGRGAPL